MHGPQESGKVRSYRRRPTSSGNCREENILAAELWAQGTHEHSLGHACLAVGVFRKVWCHGGPSALTVPPHATHCVLEDV